MAFWIEFGCSNHKSEKLAKGLAGLSRVQLIKRFGPPDSERDLELQDMSVYDYPARDSDEQLEWEIGYSTDLCVYLKRNVCLGAESGCLTH